MGVFKSCIHKKKMLCCQNNKNTVTNWHANGCHCVTEQRPKCSHGCVSSPGLQSLKGAFGGQINHRAARSDVSNHQNLKNTPNVHFKCGLLFCDCEGAMQVHLPLFSIPEWIVRYCCYFFSYLYCHQTGMCWQHDNWMEIFKFQITLKFLTEGFHLF